MVQINHFLFLILHLAQIFIDLYKEFHFQCNQFNYKYPCIEVLLIGLKSNSYLKIFLIMKYPKYRKNLLIKSIIWAKDHLFICLHPRSCFYKKLKTLILNLLKLSSCKLLDNSILGFSLFRNFI